MTEFDAGAADRDSDIPDKERPEPVPFDAAVADEALVTEIRAFLAFNAHEAVSGGTFKQLGAWALRQFEEMGNALEEVSQDGINDMEAALTGYRLKKGAVLIDDGYVMVNPDGSLDTSQSAYEREPNILRMLTLFGSVLPTGKAATLLTKTGAESKLTAAAARRVAYKSAEAKGLPMDAAARNKRAAEMGYSDEVFYRGDPKQPGAYNSGAFFSRSKEYADGFAEGAADAYRLSPGRTLSLDGTIKASDFADIMRGVEQTNGVEAAKRFAKAIPIDKTGITPE